MNAPETLQPNERQLLEQYKLYVQMADNLSSRRDNANKLYISLLSGLCAVIALTIKDLPFSEGANVVFMIMGLLGVLVCYVWHINLKSYRQLNSGKFKVIHEIEEMLAFPCYSREWDVLGRGKDKRKYIPLTRVESAVPKIIGLPYLLLLAYWLYQVLVRSA